MSRCARGNDVEIRREIVLSRLTSRIDVGVVEFTALQRLEFELRRAAVVGFLDDLDRHAARNQSQVQQNGQQHANRAR